MVQLYEMRWGIEIEFRGLKQTLKGSKLRCRNADRLYVELHWSILSMAIAELFALKEQIPNATPNEKQEHDSEQYSPKKRSLANTMRAIYNCLDELLETPEPHQDLFSLLAQAVTDDYHRRSSKKARYRPRNSKQKNLGTPKVRKLEPHEREKIRTDAQENAYRLPFVF